MQEEAVAAARFLGVLGFADGISPFQCKKGTKSGDTFEMGWSCAVAYSSAESEVRHVTGLMEVTGGSQALGALCRASICRL